MNAEQRRLENPDWKRWGPYVSDRQWATVREDYSPDGDAWEYATHDMARSKAFRWGEEGIGGICDDQQLLCFALAFWNKKDPIIKERYFGLTNYEGNHGEDVKELYYYLDSTPTHSYMKMLYKYPQQEFPYQLLINENKKRNRQQPEFELIDTGLFNDDNYFDIFLEYAKAAENDILIKITIHNRGKSQAPLNVLPTLWFRNTWSWGFDDYRPELISTNDGNIMINHRSLGDYMFYLDLKTELLFCNNESNLKRLHGAENKCHFTKDGINDYIVYSHHNAINPNATGTRAAANYDITIDAGASVAFRFMLRSNNMQPGFADFEQILATRKREADEFYQDVQAGMETDDEKLVQRQAFAGMLWSKQFYYYDVDQWLQGDPAQPPPPPSRKHGRNYQWSHLNNADIISMPDKWEFPWYAAWDLAFHCIPFAMLDSHFAKHQLLLLTKEWFMHPNGQFPAYEWSFDDVNPPVHAWAAWRVYKIDENQHGQGDVTFLKGVFQKLLLNFTWWVNRKDRDGNNVFQGGFLGLDNIGVFDRSVASPNWVFEQADATAWMAMYSLNMMHISLELALHDSVYEDMATKFFEHFLYIAGSMESMSTDPAETGLWDECDQFFYDAINMPNEGNKKLKVRSMVGLIPLFAVEVLDHQLLDKLPGFAGRLKWFLDNRPYLASLVSRWQEKNVVQKHLLSLLRGHRMKRILRRMLDETEFLSDYGIRSLSKYYLQHPYEIQLGGNTLSVEYTPGEATTSFFGGNSNWRGPIWLPVNFLIVESLQRFHYYYTDDFKVEHPTNSGRYLTLNEIADEIRHRLTKLFLRNNDGIRPALGANEKMQCDPQFNNYILFYEYFHGDTGKGLGASHQTGWTGLIAKLLQPRRNPFEELRITHDTSHANQSVHLDF
jgi:hypothetical protein